VPIRTRRWNDPASATDGLRLLICRYRPRALPKARETWQEWEKELGPSAELLAAFHGKGGAPIPWAQYRARYLREMRAQRARLGELARRVAAGETVTLLCASSCTDESRCHRSLLRELIEKAAALSGARPPRGAAPSGASPSDASGGRARRSSRAS
jgi:uncharacterized protein YeaO (DUF488 family)